MSILNSVIKAFVGDKAKKDVKALQPMVEKVNSFEASLEALSHDELRQKTLDFKARIAIDREPIMEKIQALQSEVETSDDVDRKESIYGEIDALNEEAYKLTENTLNDLLPEAFAVVKETAKRFVNNSSIQVEASAFDRQLSGSKEYVSLEGDHAVWSNSWDAAGKEVTWDMVHYDVQLIGGICMHQGNIAEMQTGEGKTLVATLPLYLNALSGHGAHLVTVNE